MGIYKTTNLIRQLPSLGKPVNMAASVWSFREMSLLKWSCDGIKKKTKQIKNPLPEDTATTKRLW